MDEIIIKQRELDKKRLENLKKDLVYLRNDTYQIIEVDYPKKEITIKGLLLYRLSTAHSQVLDIKRTCRCI